MHRQQLWIAVALILTESAVFAYLSETWTVPILVTVAAIAALSTEWRFQLNPYRRLVAALMLAIPFTIQWAFSPYEPAHLRTFIMYALAHAIGQYGLALQTGYIWVKRPDEIWSAAFPLWGVCILMAASDVLTTRVQNVVFQIFVLGFIALTAAYFSWARTTVTEQIPRSSWIRLWFSGLTIGITCLISVVGSQMLERSWSTLERLYTEWMFAGSQDGVSGFSRQARLGSISERPSSTDQTTVLRIYAEEEPGYLRGAAYDRYRNGSWTNDSPKVTVQPDQNAGAAITEQAEHPLYHFPVQTVPVAGRAESQVTSWRKLEVWPTPSVSDAVFAPLEARWVEFPQADLQMDGYGIAYPDSNLGNTNYREYLPDFRNVRTPPSAAPTLESGSDPAMSPNPGNQLTNLLAVPDDLDSRIKDLADGIFAGHTTPDQKVLAVSSWFRKNYHYELGMQVPAGQDALTWFLTRRPAAHCEYFASGTAILLRLGGVPCRYVTGFVSTEYNYLGGYWLARNKDAHAWVEAWIPDRGWVAVESTPSAGIPHSNHSIQPRHLWDDVLLRVQMLKTYLASGTARGLTRAGMIVLSMLFTTPHGWLMLCGAGLWAVVLLRRHFRFWTRQQVDPASRDFHRLLLAVDQRLAQLTWTRDDSETLHQFADRLATTSDAHLEAAAGWYREYGEQRYRSQSSEDAIEPLKLKLHAVLEQLKMAKRPVDRGFTLGLPRS